MPLESISGVRNPTLNAKPATIIHNPTATSTHTQASAIEVLDTRASTCRTVKAVSPSQ